MASIRRIKQTIEIEFWAASEDIANEAFEYVYDKNIDRGTDEELEFNHFIPADDGEGGTCSCTYTHESTATYYPGSYWEPEDWDYPDLVDEDDPRDWFEAFNKEKGDDELIMDISCLETIDELGEVEEGW